MKEKLAEMVDQFNQYRDQGEYEKMEVVAKRARELAPDDPHRLQRLAPGDNPDDFAVS